MTNHDKNEILEYLILEQLRKDQGSFGDTVEALIWGVFYLGLFALSVTALFFTFFDL